MFAPVRCCFDVMFLMFASHFALSVHQALCFRREENQEKLIEGKLFVSPFYAGRSWLNGIFTF